MKLWIVVNHFLRTPKFRELEERFSDAASYFGIEYQIVTNSECIIGCEDNRITAGIIPNGSDPVLFWDKDIRLGQSPYKMRTQNCIIPQKQLLYAMIKQCLP